MRRSTSFKLPFLAGFALEGEAQRRAVDLDVPVAQRGQAEALVVAGIGCVADADHGVVEQPDDRGDRPARAAARGVAGPRPPRARSRGSASAKATRLEYFTSSRQADQRWMIAILLAAALVAAGSLDVAVRLWRNPHVGPGRRDGQAADAGHCFAFAEFLSTRSEIEEAPRAALAADARFFVAGVNERCAPGRGFRQGQDFFEWFGAVQHGNSDRRQSAP